MCVRCRGQLGSCLPVCPLGALYCVCGVPGHLAPFHRCACSSCCLARAVSWATWLLFTGAHAGWVVSRMRCPGPLGSCSPVCWLVASCCMCGVLDHFASVRRCANSVCCVVCVVSWSTWLLLTGVLARCDVMCVRCLGPLGHLCAGSVVSLVRCPGQLSSCSPVCWLGVLCCVCGVLGHLAPVHRCARLVGCVAYAVSWATSLLFTGVLARCFVLHVRCPGPLRLCSPVCLLCVLCRVCGVLVHLAPVKRCAPSECCVACTVS